MTSVPSRINDPDAAELTTVGERLTAGERLIVQFSEALYTSAQLDVIDALCAQHGSALEVRFYGHYRSVFDGGVLLQIPSVVNLSVDCLQEVRNIDAIAQLSNLRELSLGVFDITDTRLLRFPNLRSLRSLALGDTRSKNLDLSYLVDYVSLESLRVSGHTKGIEAISSSPALASLTLSCISKSTRLTFISTMRNLKRLRLILGGRPSISEVEAPQLHELEVIRVRGLAELAGLDRFPGLRSLAVEDQIRIERLSFTPANSELLDLRIFNCKTLRELSGLEHLGQLRQFRVGRTALDPDQLLAWRMPTTLEVCAVYTGKERENRRIRKALDARGYRE